MKLNGRSVLLAVVGVLGSVGVVRADDLIVTDCQGKVRLVESMDASGARDIRALISSLGGAGAEASASLTNVASSEVLKASIENGSVVFRQVDAGKWSLCLLPTSLALGDVSLVQKDASRSTEQAALYGVGLAAGVGGVISLVSVGSGSGSSDGVRLGETAPLAAVTDSAASSETAPVLDGHSSRRPRAAAECFIDNEVTPVSPFS